jgi:hypothetical protein
MDAGTILSAIGLLLYLLNFLTCITMIILIGVRIRPLKSNIPMILICNTYINSLFVSLLMLIMYTYTLLGNIGLSLSFAGRWCQLRIYFVHVCFCSLFYSFVLQAMFRLFRIVLYRYRHLQSFNVCMTSILLQWMISFLCILPNLLLHDFQYVPTEFNCWIDFENVRGLVMLTFNIFNNPLSIIFIIYTHIVRYVRRTAHRRQIRQKANQRDLAVLKRIVILVFIVVSIGLPTVVLIIVYLVTNHIIPFAYHIQGLSISLGVLVASICSIFVTPQIQEIFKQNIRRIHPTEILVVTSTRTNVLVQEHEHDTAHY